MPSGRNDFDEGGELLSVSNASLDSKGGDDSGGLGCQLAVAARGVTGSAGQMWESAPASEQFVEQAREGLGLLLRAFLRKTAAQTSKGSALLCDLRVSAIFL